MVVPAQVRRRIPQWRSKYGRIWLYETGDHSFVFRSPTYREVLTYRECVTTGTEEGDNSPPSFVVVDAEDHLVASTLLWASTDPLEDPDFKAYDFWCLLSAIVRSAGFSQNEFRRRYDVEKSKAATRDDLTVIILICRAFPSVSPDDVTSWPLDKILRHLTIAEEILGFDLYTGPRRAEGAQQPNTVTFESGPKSVAQQRREQKARRHRDVPVVPAPDPRTIPDQGRVDVDKENQQLSAFMNGP